MMGINDILKANLTTRYQNRFSEYQNSEIVTFLLKNKIDIRDRLEYFYGVVDNQSVSATAIFLNETKIFEIMIKNRAKFNPIERLDEMGKNTYTIARILGRDKIIKIIEKYDIKTDCKSKISKKRCKELFNGFIYSGYSYKQIEFWKSKNIDIFQNIPFIRNCLSSNSVIRGAIITGDIKLYELILKNKRLFKIYFDSKIDNATNFELAETTGNKKIIQSLEIFRTKIDRKKSIMFKGQHYIEARRYKEYEQLKKNGLGFDLPYNKGLWSVEAWIYGNKNDRPGAIKILKRRLEFNPKDDYAHYYITNNLYVLGRNTKNKVKRKKIYQEAIKHIQKSIKIISTRRTNFIGYYILKGDVLEQMGKYKEAIQAYRKESIMDLNGCSNKKIALEHIERCKEAMKK